MTGFGDLNLKLQLILDISVFMSSLNFMLTRVEHGKSFITGGPVIDTISGRGRMVVQWFHVGINRKKFAGRWDRHWHWRACIPSDFDPDRATVPGT